MKRCCLKYIFISIVMMGIVCSCVGDETFTQEPGPSLPEIRKFTLRLSIPGTNAPVTFAYSQVGENEIRTVDILAFRIDPDGEHFYKHIPVRSIESDNNTSKKLDITIDAIDTRLILLANVGHLFTDEMNELLKSDSLSGNITKQTLLERFVFNFNSPWRANSFYSDNAFPMYGESDIILAKSTAEREVKMIRAITRIDIANEIRNTKWSIDSIYIYNTKNKGFVAPAFDKRGYIIENTNIPSTAKINRTVFGYKFEQNAGTTTPSMEREIYITEDSQAGETPTTIILKMEHEGKQPQFFCVDLKGVDGERMPLLRNYRYRIFIKGITGEGYSTAEKAFATANSSHISTGIETNEIGLSNIVFNSKYKLGVSDGQINFSSDGGWEGMAEEGESFYSMKVYTTYSGWTASFSESLDTWLRFSDPAISGTTAEFPSSCHQLELIAEPNQSQYMRSGNIEIKAGNLRLDVTIVQDGNKN